MILRTHENVTVLRDDLYPYGSKARFLRGLFRSIPHDEVVYGSSPRWGLAQVSLAYIGKKFGKKVTLFIPLSKEVHPYTQRAINLGAHVVQVPMGFTSVCESRARKHATANGAMLLPCGLDTPEVINSIAEHASGLKIDPDEVWTVASSGTLTKGLQQAFPRATFYAVRVGRALEQRSVGRAQIIESGMMFNCPAKILPPFPSVPEYDAKAWKFIPKDGKLSRFFWNVGA